MKRFVIAITGGTVVLLGITMIALPGPAVVVIPAGLAILATEFLWARRALQVFKGMTARARASIRCSAAEGGGKTQLVCSTAAAMARSMPANTIWCRGQTPYQ
jgi:hypothetical protein